MHDTPPEIRKLQLAFFMKKTAKERFEMAIEQCESVKKIVENTIRAENPSISMVELKVKVFERYYKNDFSEEQLEQIKTSIRTHHSKCHLI